ncbi:hypothetical protein SK3146_02618 [Paenibacillus konkukensis]|uniref:Uncharacterized protein n=1 Tax=Paenibacillus konkukensis TaxID=2020716 RepID=A0ABY4RLP6_9BACL|nr:hypothetical protein [Paenibacillus konkukensis]UQZ83431.1 hypothetical protein SK3146_02618 [Paenibacillus konkukensis]
MDIDQLLEKLFQSAEDRHEWTVTPFGSTYIVEPVRRSANAVELAEEALPSSPNEIPPQ